MQTSSYVQLQGHPFSGSCHSFLKSLGILFNSHLIVAGNQLYFSLNLSDCAGNLSLSLADLLVQGIFEQRGKLSTFHGLMNRIILMISICQTMFTF